MNNNQTNQQPKSTSKRNAIISLVLGVISILPVIVCLVAFLLALIAPGFMYYGATRGQSILVLYTTLGLIYLSPISFLASVVSLIFGKRGLKSTKKNFAIAGMMLSTITLISLGILYLGYLGIFR